MIKKVLTFCARTDIFFILLLWLIVLLLAGTIAQKDLGLYVAQHKYFSSYILWIGDIVPTPGGYTIMALIFVGLFSKMLLSEWRMKNAGTIITHIGVLLLILGGFLTAMFSYEGSMTIKEGAVSNFIEDYNDIELAVIDTSLKEEDTVFAFQQGWIKEGRAIQHENLPFDIEILSYCRNCKISRLKEPRSGEYPAAAMNFKLQEVEREKEEEQNLSGITFKLKSDDENVNGIYTVFEFMPITQTITIDDKKYLISLRHKRTYLPFEIELIDFEKQVYPGTEMARSYSSEVILKDNGSKWQSLISMNSPVRYKGYTLFQASFMEGVNEQTTILAVVKNVGRMFPYISSIIMCIGLIIHLVQRMPSLIKKQRKGKNA